MKNEVEAKIEKLVKDLGIEDEVSLKEVKEIIYNEKEGNKEFNYLISMFVSRVPDINRANEIAQTISEAWNTFPHKSLGGLSPADIIKSRKISN